MEYVDLMTLTCDLSTVQVLCKWYLVAAMFIQSLEIVCIYPFISCGAFYVSTLFDLKTGSRVTCDMRNIRVNFIKL